jgi:hypothetical protein
MSCCVVLCYGIQRIDLVISYRVVSDILPYLALRSYPVLSHGVLGIV